MRTLRRCSLAELAIGTALSLLDVRAHAAEVTEHPSSPQGAGGSSAPQTSGATATKEPSLVTAPAQPTGVSSTEVHPLLTLSDALTLALKNHPSMRQARAQVEAAEGRVEQSRSGYLPQVTGTARYQRQTGNSVPTPGGATVVPPASTKLYDYFNFQVTASQLIYDFGQTNGRWSAAESTVDAEKATERATRNQTLGDVYVAYYQAAAARSLVHVAEETLDNQQRHYTQIDSTVQVGMRPEIDRAQAKADVATARVSLITARNNYETAKAQLSQVIGGGRDTDYDVSEDMPGPVEGEGQTAEQLIQIATERRPDIAALARQRESQQRTLRAYRGGYGPSLSASTTASEAGIKLDDMRYNWNVGVTLSWPILQGGLTHGQVRESAANLEVTEAQLQNLKLQIRTQIIQAKLAIVASIAAIASNEEAVTNLQERLKLAEGRYASGVGNVIELSDAQVAFTNAESQLVQSRFNLAVARAQLLTALGLR